MVGLPNIDFNKTTRNIFNKDCTKQQPMGQAERIPVKKSKEVSTKSRHKRLSYKMKENKKMLEFT